MKGVCVTSSKTPRRGMNTVKVETKMRNCLVQQDAYVVPFFVVKINMRVPEITILKSKNQLQIDNAKAEESKTKQVKVPYYNSNNVFTTTKTTALVVLWL